MAIGEKKMKERIILPGRMGYAALLGELWEYRSLCLALAGRDLKVRYAQTVLGWAWLLLRPAVIVAIMSFVFGRIAGVDSGPVPHFIYTIGGYLGWLYFSDVASLSGSSLLGSQYLIKRIYFPRLVIPVSKALSALPELLFILLIELLLMAAWKVGYSAGIAFLPLFILWAVICGWAGGIWISALSIRFRDFQHILPFILRAGLFITPIAYPASAVPEAWRLWYFLNPLAGVVEGIKWSLFGQTLYPDLMWISGLVSLIALLTGIWYFRRVERTMADHL